MKNSIQHSLLELTVFVKIILGILLALYLVSGVYTISPNELGVLMRFGRIYDDKVRPGVHYHLPYPISRVIKVPVKKVNTLFIDDFADTYDMDSTPRKFYDLTGLASYCLSGDNNIVGLALSIQYRIVEPANYLFLHQNPDRLIYEVSCNSIIKTLAHFDVDKILTYGKKDLAMIIKQHIQDNITQLDLGLEIYFVDIKSINPPESVQSYFDDVINAKIDKKKMVNEAQSYHNTRIHQARGQKATTLEQAKAYKFTTISAAEGEAQRFLDRVSGFNNQRELVIHNTYLAFINDVMTKVKRLYLVDKENAGGAKLRFIVPQDSQPQ